MLDVARRPTWREVREMEIEELACWAAYLEEREGLDDLKWDLRLLGVCMAMAAFAPQIGDGNFDPAIYFPSLFAEHDSPGGGGGAMEITDGGQMRDVLREWCAASGGTVITAKQAKKEHAHG